jgi:thymidylate kinase
LIAVCGIDGSGKTTIANEIKQYFVSHGMERCIVIDAMKGGKYIEHLKTVAVQTGISMRELYSPEILNIAWSLDLIDKYENIVKPYLKKDYIVILHRSDLCCRTYSQLFSQRTSVINRILDNAAFQVDLHIYLDVEPEIAYHRIQARNQGGNITEKEQLQRLRSAKHIYIDLLATSRYSDVIRINGNEELNEILNSMRQKLDNLQHCNTQ